MNIYKVKYELCYPESDNDIRIAYVVADSFYEAEIKVERNNKKEYETAYIKSIKLLDAEIYI